MPRMWGWLAGRDGPAVPMSCSSSIGTSREVGAAKPSTSPTSMQAAQQRGVPENESAADRTGSNDVARDVYAHFEFGPILGDSAAARLRGDYRVPNAPHCLTCLVRLICCLACSSTAQWVPSESNRPVPALAVAPWTRGRLNWQNVDATCDHVRRAWRVQRSPRCGESRIRPRGEDIVVPGSCPPAGCQAYPVCV